MKKSSSANRILEQALERRRAEAVPASRVLCRCSAEALLGNYRAISAQLPDHSVLPMIKANAYGHGGGWAAKILAREPSLYGLGVATLQEGREAREALGPRGRKVPILVFSETLPWSEGKGHYCELYGLTPVIGSDEGWKAFFSQGWAQRLSYELEFNTGMNRLGIGLDQLAAVRKNLRTLPADRKPQGIFSHLAMGESPESALSRTQLQRFRTLRSELAPELPAAHFHLANSAAIWNQKHWGLRDLTDVIRPGIALYGVPPWPGAPGRGIEPVLQLHAQVLQTHLLKKGDQLGYGGTFSVSGEESAWVAILGAGYADGFPRLWSNRGHAWVDGGVSRFLGTVSMDLSAVRCGSKTRPGGWVEILGPHVDIWAQAQAAGTIPYELLTSIASRVAREYV